MFDNNMLPSILLCGYERGGTTLLSEVFRSNGYESGFECGVLMSESPSDFVNCHPYIDMLETYWGFSSQEARSLCKGDFKEFYNNLFNLYFPEGVNNKKLFDKTPIYMSKLGKVLSRTDFINKACVIHRDPRSMFVSWAKRVGENYKIEKTVINNFDNFCNRYLSYFIGSAAHLSNPDVMFVPFEDLCLRESFYYKVIGQFTDGVAFTPRVAPSRYENVTGNKMDLNKIFEFDQFLSKKTQNKILEKTKLASMFFASSTDQVKYGEHWLEKKDQIEMILKNFEIKTSSVIIDGDYFESMTYLLRYPDVLKAKVNPVEHYKNYGITEKRMPC